MWVWVCVRDFRKGEREKKQNKTTNIEASNLYFHGLNFCCSFVVNL